MSVRTETNEEFNVSAKYNPDWNPHYDFSNPKNLAEINKMTTYDNCFRAVYGVDRLEPGSDEYEQADAFLKKTERDALGGKDGYAIGVRVDSSKWGINTVLDFKNENGEDICTKEITVFPNNMLSLQSHNGRREEWEVRSGKLTLIMDAEVYDVSDAGVFKVTDGANEKITDPAIAQKNGNYWSIILPPGSAHCMINRSDSNVTVVETQRGITREADNKRYADQQRDNAAPRATIPLTSENLYKSALLYWKIEAEIARKPGLNYNISYEPKAA